MSDPATHTVPDPESWAAENSANCCGIFADLGESPDLMRTDPVAGLRRIESGLAEGWAPRELDSEEWVRFSSFLLIVLAEFLISCHGARWGWLTDPSSPLGGRWVLVGFPHLLGRETGPVDVGQIVQDARSGDDVSLIALVDRAEAESGMRVLSG
ncbi:hypothetical protein ACIQBJ_01725 [Kitasatospora sp. NPDC088391]|uniref:hypothetical protein n=1 Tax=Kitasatospora sp. NPDC088391 TaxID=3364074 RepID=UPI00381F67B4